MTGPKDSWVDVLDLCPDCIDCNGKCHCECHWTEKDYKDAAANYQREGY